MMMTIFMLFLLAICFQLFTYCHAGSQLADEVCLFLILCKQSLRHIFQQQSAAVADAIYDSYWYKATPSTQKLIGFFLKRSQKSVIISSGFYVASLETFKSVSFYFKPRLQSLMHHRFIFAELAKVQRIKRASNISQLVRLIHLSTYYILLKYLNLFVNVVLLNCIDFKCSWILHSNLTVAFGRAVTVYDYYVVINTSFTSSKPGVHKC